MIDAHLACGIARDTLEPTIRELARSMYARGATDADVDLAIAAIAESYALGHRDGQRYAVAQIAPETERLGLHLHLAPDLARPAGAGRAPGPRPR